MKVIYLTVAATIAVVLAGCGGGSSNDNRTNEHNGTDVALQGTVPGTLIEAFCDDNSYHKVNSVNNGTVKHPFNIKLPKGVPCRVVMTMNENDSTNKITTPIEFIKNGNKMVSVKLLKDTDVGHIPLPNVSTSTNDANGDHIKDTPLDINVSDKADIEIVDDSQKNPFDKDHNGKIDGFEDKNHNGTPDGFEDKNGDGKADINEDKDGNGVPDGYENNSNGNDNGGDNNGNGDT